MEMIYSANTSGRIPVLVVLLALSDGCKLELSSVIVASTGVEYISSYLASLNTHGNYFAVSLRSHASPSEYSCIVRFDWVKKQHGLTRSAYTRVSKTSYLHLVKSLLLLPCLMDPPRLLLLRLMNSTRLLLSMRTPLSMIRPLLFLLFLVL